MLLEDLYTVSCSKPRDCKNEKFTATEYRAYCIGFSMGTVAALRSATFACERFRHYVRERRAANKRAQSA